MYEFHKYYDRLAANWKTLGMAPIMLCVLMHDYMWHPDQLDGAMRVIVGDDYHLINGTQWVYRLEGNGYEFPDGTPVLSVINSALEEFYQADKLFM